MTQTEYDRLDDFLYKAVFVPEGTPAPPRSITQESDLQVYLDDFGDRPDDLALVAESNGRLAGCIWARIMNDYGHIDDQTPSLAISLYPEYRNQGIGTALLNSMLDHLKQRGYRQVSLSVQKANFALNMYRKAGFEIVGEDKEEVIMVCPLQTACRQTALNPGRTE
jgi:ribosomal protein S18 acetylase RimI-like enzyme